MKYKKIIYLLIILLLFIIIYSYLYLNNYYKADNIVNEYLNSNDNITVIKKDNIYYFDGPGEDSALIFYPGGKVEDISYSPILYRLAEEGIDCFLIKMPFNLAILNKNAADNIIYGKYEYNNWYIGGHSLGGVVASMYANDNLDTITGLILLASYPTNKIDDNIDLLSIYGTNDGVLNINKYKENKKYWNNNSKELTIIGGNHSQFGYYGFQDGDNKSDISREEQQNKTIEYVLKFVNR